MRRLKLFALFALLVSPLAIWATGISYQNTGGGGSAGSAGAPGPAGAAGSSVYAQTSIGGSSTAITDLAIVSSVNGPLVEQQGSSFTINLSSVAMFPSTGTFSGLVNFKQRIFTSSGLFTNGATVDDAANVIMGTQFAYMKNGNIGIGTISPQDLFEFYAPNDFVSLFRRNTEVSQGLISLWFLTGTGGAAATNTLAGIRIETTQADPSAIKGDMEFFTNSGDLLHESARLTGTGRFGIGISTPASILHVSTGPGTIGPITEISTGTTNLFEVNGSSIVMDKVMVKVSSLAANGAVMAAHLAATNAPADTQVLKYDAATGKGTWAADNTGGSGGLPFAEGATNYIQSSTAATSGVFSVSSGTVNGSLTARSNLVVVGIASAAAVAVNGTGALNIVGASEVQIDANGDGTKDFWTNSSSISMPIGNYISLRDKDRFTTPAFGSGTFTTYIATPTMGIASSTLGSFQFSNAISSQANFCVFPWLVPDDIDLTASISVSSFGITLGAADTGSQVYQISIATNQASSNVTETKFSGSGAWLSSMTVVVPADAAGAVGDLETSTGTIVWGGVQSTLIPGTLNYIIVSRDGDHGSDTSTVNSYSTFFTISYKRRFYQ